MPRKIKLILNDFHLGKGRFLADGRRNPLEDFFFDEKFVEFVEYQSRGEWTDAEVEIVLNGDFFNHLQTDYTEEHPDIISEGVALRRTNEILKGHAELFSALKRFAEGSGRSIAFLLGNHDVGLLFPAVGRRLREVLGPRIKILTDPYRFDGVHIEHGNQYFADNAYNKERYFLTKDLPEPIVNLPWGSYFVIHLLNKVRLERPYFSKIYPFKYYLRWALIHETRFALRTVARLIFYFVSLRFTKVPHRRSSIIRTLKIMKEVGLPPPAEREAKKILLTEKEVRIVIFGHTHHATIRQIAPGKTFVNTGVWNEQISLELSNAGRVVRLTYAQLEYDAKGIPQVSLKEWKGSYREVEEIND